MARSALLAVCTFLVAASVAQAHFIWIKSEASDDATVVRAGFGEAREWDTELAPRIKQTHYWTRKTSGNEIPIEMDWNQTAGEYRGVINDVDTRAVLGACDYGVVTLGEGEPFYLQYGAKCLVGRPDFWSDDTPSPQSRVEILAVAENKSIALTVLQFGRPVAAATLKCNAPNGQTVKLTTDAMGIAHWPRSGAGNYACYVGVTTDEAGEKDGKSYKTKRDYATLDLTLDE